MNLFERFVLLLQTEMERPKPYGLFHLLWLIAAFVVLVIICRKKESESDKKIKWIIGIYGIVAFVLETLKQTSWAMNVNDGIVSWSYSWYSAPFQLCTTPIYVCLICLFLKENKVRNALFSYMAFYTILGSIATAIRPNDVFVRDILINVHTMWLHIGSLVVSLYLLISGRVKLTKNSFIGATITFLIFIAIALVMDIGVYQSGILNGANFNMFYISPYFISALPVFDIIQKSVPYLLYLLIYIVALMLGAGIIFGISKVFERIINKNKNSKEIKNA